MQQLLTTLFAITILCGSVRAQINQPGDLPGEPIVGQPCPDFLFTTVDYFNKSSVSLKDFKGKWLVMDYWSKGCSGCIANFPNVSKEQIEFKDKVQFLMVSYADKANQNRELYDDYHKTLNLAMPCAYDDVDTLKSVAARFNVGLLPHAIIVDPNGIVRAVTTKVPKNKLKKLLEGENPMFGVASYANEKEKVGRFVYTRKNPYLVGNNGGNDSLFLFRSLLSKWSTKNPSVTIQDTRNGRLEALGVDLMSLYRFAYFGVFKIFSGDSSDLYNTVWAKPVIEVKDSVLFQPDYGSGENLFCYSLVVPHNKASEAYMRQTMQKDLEQYFNYTASVEVRKMPYWRLVISDSANIKLKTKGGSSGISANGRPWRRSTVRNLPMKDLVGLIEYYSGVSSDDGPPLIDETGIKGNVDIDLDWVKNDFNIVKQELNKHGLDLVIGEKEMKVLVVKDKVN